VNLKSLRLNGKLFCTNNVFAFLPENLQTLKVAWFHLKDAQKVEISTKRITLQRFVLCVRVDNRHVFFDRDPFKRQHHFLFDYFRRFINFEDLKELIIEVDGEEIDLDTETYRIK
ncbi:putative LRR containing protein, partial [Trachipleistophora hominis]